MRLLKRDRIRLERILTELKRGQAYIMDKEILVCRKQRYASTTLHYQNAQGEICYSLDKEIGSELALLHSGILGLEKALRIEEGEETP